MAQIMKKIGAAFLAFALVLTSFGSFTLSAVSAASDYTSINLKVVDASGNPVSGLKLVWNASTNDDFDALDFDDATASDGTVTYECTDDEDEDETYTLGISESSDYAMDSTTTATFAFGQSGMVVDTVNGAEYNGGTVTVNVKSTKAEEPEPAKTDVLKVKAVDASGNAVEGVKFYFYMDYDAYCFTTGSDGIASYTMQSYDTGNSTVGVSARADYTCSKTISVNGASDGSKVIVNTVDGAAYDGNPIEFVVEAKASEPEVTTTNVLKVKTVDESGNAVSGVKLYFDDQVETFTTGSDGVGTYTIGQYANGTKTVGVATSDTSYSSDSTLSVACSGYPAVIDTVNGTAYTGDEVTLTVKAKSTEPAAGKTGTLKVKAVDESGNAVEGVTFYFYTDWGSYRFTTGADGIASYTLKSDDYYPSNTVTVSSSSDYTTTKSILVDGATENGNVVIGAVDGAAYDGSPIEFTVKAKSTEPATNETNIIKVKAVDAEGNPVEGCIFYFYYDSSYYQFTTGADGIASYTLGDYDNGSNPVGVSKDSNYSSEKTISVTGTKNGSNMVVSAVDGAAYDGNPVEFVVTEKAPAATITSVAVSPAEIAAEGGKATVTVTGTNLPETFKYYRQYRYEDTWGSSEGWVESSYTAKSATATGTETERTFEIDIPAYDSAEIQNAPATAFFVQVSANDGTSYTKSGDIAVKEPVPSITSVTVNPTEISAEGATVTVTVSGKALPETFKYYRQYYYQGTYGQLDDYLEGVSSAKTATATGTATERTFQVELPAAAIGSKTATAFFIQVSADEGTNYTKSDNVAVTGGTSGGDEDEAIHTMKFKVVDDNGDAVSGVVLKLNPKTVAVADALTLVATDSNGETSIDVSNVDYADDYAVALADSTNYTYSGSDYIEIAYDTKSMKYAVSKYNEAAYDGSVKTITVAKNAPATPEITSVSITPSEIEATGGKATVTVQGTNLPETFTYYRQYKYEDVNGSAEGYVDSKWVPKSATATGSATERTFEIDLPDATTYSNTPKAYFVNVSADDGTNYTKSGDVTVKEAEPVETPAITSVTLSPSEIAAEGGKVTVTVTGTSLPETFTYYRQYKYQGTYSVTDDYLESKWSTKSATSTGTSTERTFEIEFPASSSTALGTAVAYFVNVSADGTTFKTSNDVTVKAAAQVYKTLKVKVVDGEGNPVEGVALQLKPQYGSALKFTGTTAADGTIEYTCCDCASELPDEDYDLTLQDESAYKAVKTPVVYIEEDDNGNYISTIDEVDYDGSVYTFVVNKVSKPEITAVSSSKTEVSADGETVTITVTGKDLPETLYFKKFYDKYDADFNEYSDSTIDWSGVSVNATGTATERTFEVALPKSSDYPKAFAWKVAVAASADGTYVKSADIAITGVEKPELISITSAATVASVSAEGEKVTVTVKGTGLPETLYCKLYNDKDQDVATSTVTLIGSDSHEKTFEYTIPAVTDSNSTEYWVIGVNTKQYAGTYVKTENIEVITSAPIPETKDRIAGPSRYDTAIESANELKGQLGVEKFGTIVVANGDNYPDALAGSYLAKVKDAPIVLVNASTEAKIKAYIEENLAAGGKVYLLGGEGVISKNFKNSLSSYDVERLGGKDRYETNLLILTAAGVTNQDLLVCTGTGYADSLSASATGKPILLVGASLTDAQKKFLGELSSTKIYAIGGTGVVTETVFNSVKAAIKTSPEAKRVAGASRYETSVAVAEEFFGKGVKTVILAYAQNFPDGLTGGPLAAKIGAPLILVSNDSSKAAEAYCSGSVVKSIALGGTAVVSEEVRKAMLVAIL